MNTSDLILLLSDIADTLPVAAQLSPEDLRKLQARVCKAIITFNPPSAKQLRDTQDQISDLLAKLYVLKGWI